MTTEIDPIRFTDSSTDAPELLRGAFAAGAKEGPSPAQMRILAVKLAAVSAGTAVVAGASSAQASTTLGGGAVATTSALPLVKIVVAVAMVGASALGGVALMSKSEPARVPAPNALVVNSVPKQSAAPLEVAPTFAPAAKSEIAAPAAADTSESLGTERRNTGEVDAPAAQVIANTKAARVEEQAVAQRRTLMTKTKPAASTKSVGVAQEAHEQASNADVPSEVELLRRARTALASRPREAFALTEQHREHYPRGVFAQERDALAIEALLRAGDTDTARRLAQSFVSAHPSSPHAHRFRETLGLH